jgi:hypothetical protein
MGHLKPTPERTVTPAVKELRFAEDMTEISPQNGRLGYSRVSRYDQALDAPAIANPCLINALFPVTRLAVPPEMRQLRTL